MALPLSCDPLGKLLVLVDMCRTCDDQRATGNEIVPHLKTPQLSLPVCVNFPVVNTFADEYMYPAHELYFL